MSGTQSGSLRNFKRAEIVLSNEDCYAVLRFFFRSDLSLMPGQLEHQDHAFAQALLLEGIEMTASISTIQSLADALLHRPKDFHQLEELCQKFVREALKEWFTRSSETFRKDPKIYVSIRNTLATKWRRALIERQNTGEYYGYYMPSGR
jgi:hypothetical protein